MSAPLPRDHASARERRERYCGLRRQGLSVVDAAAACGVFGVDTRGRYERWFQAAERGEQVIPARMGRRPSLLLVLAAAVVLAAGCGTTHPSTAGRHAHQAAALRHLTRDARTRTRACAAGSGRHPAVLARCAAPGYRFTPVWQCVIDAIAAHAYTAAPISSTRAALPRCVARARKG